MAQVASTAQQHAELLLDSLWRVWSSLPRVEGEIDTWDWIEQVDFIEEWPLVEQRLTQVEEYLAEGALAPTQIARYHELLNLIARNRPIIQRLRDT